MEEESNEMPVENDEPILVETYEDFKDHSGIPL